MKTNSSQQQRKSKRSFKVVNGKKKVSIDLAQTMLNDLETFCTVKPKHDLNSYINSKR